MEDDYSLRPFYYLDDHDLRTLKPASASSKYVTKLGLLQ